MKTLVEPCQDGSARVERVEVTAPSIVSLREEVGADWTVVGQPLRDAELRRRVVEALNEAAALPGAPCDLTGIENRDFGTVIATLDSAHEALAARLLEGRPGRRTPELLGSLVRIERVRIEVEQARTEQQRARYATVRSALSRLHGIGSVAQMLERAPIELCRCGFDRVIVSSVDESDWLVENVYVDGDPEWAAEISRVGKENPQTLDHMMLESEMMRRRAPVLISDARNDPHVHAAIGAASLSRSYVAAPVMPEGRIIGFLHADCYMSRRDVDQDDLDVLWLFAEGFGFALQRTVLQERLRFARERVQGMARTMANSMDGACVSDASMCSRSEGEPGEAHKDARVAASLVQPDSRLQSLLSPREIEVLGLMAQGKSNGEIATHLVISEGTVKSHVKHILRKLRASNRAEAVFRFMRLTTIRGGEPSPAH